MLEPGRVVRSVAGHDSGSYCMVVAANKERVFIADGRARKLAKPKAKNPLHLARTNTLLDPDTLTTDKKLREALRQFNTAGEEGGF